MARCNCAGLNPEGCNCVLQAGENVTVTGTGQSLDPWIINAVQPELTAGDGINITDGVVSADLSPLPVNQIQFIDGELYVPPPPPGGTYIGSVEYLDVGASFWTKAAYPDVKWLRVRLIGGGGGGAGATATTGNGIARGGGAGGNYTEGWIDADTLPAVVPVVIGAGGAAGAAANGSGGAGTGTSFGTILTANGGGGSGTGGGPATSGVWGTGAPSTAGIGPIQSFGQRGFVGFLMNPTSGSGGQGGPAGAGFGSAGRGGITGATSGQDGQSPGAGGGGALSIGTAAVAGGAGAPGAAYIEMWSG